MPYDISGYGALFDPRDYFGPNPTNPWTADVGPVFLPPYYRDNYLRGEALPYYLTQFELKAIRDRLRKLVGTNPFAISALSNRAHYIAGDGLTIKANPMQPEDEKLAEDVQKFVDIFAEVNDLSAMEREGQWREDEDGEFFIRLFPQRTGSLAGMTYLRFIEPELVRDPRGDSTGATSFGIETMPGDVQTIIGYQVVDDPILDYTPRMVLEAEVCHKKSCTRATAKRGLPKLYQVEPNLRRAEDLLASMSSMAKLRAKIAFIRKMQGTGKSAAETFQSDLTEVTQTDPITAAPRNIERFPLGSILTASKNVEYEFPTAGMGVAEFIPVLDAELRAIGAHLCMPEWMLSGNAGNANYSASFVAESVCVKAFQAEQERLRNFWVECRYGNRRSVLWRALQVAIDVGMFPEDLSARVRLVAEAPSLIARDQDREASTNKLYSDMGVKSRQRIQQELGIDPAEEDEQILNDKVAEARRQATQPTGDATQKKEPVQQQWDGPKTRLAVNRGFGVAEALADMLPGVTDETLLRLAAAPPGCSLQCSRVGDSVLLEAHGDCIEEWQVALNREKLTNLSIAIKPEYRYHGLARRLFGAQEDEARRVGIKRIEVIADAGEGRVGHIVWPKLGFDCDAANIVASEPLPAVFAEAKSLSEILSQPAGLTWWSETGQYAPLYKTLVPEDKDVTKADLEATIRAIFAESHTPQATQTPVTVNVQIPNDLFASMKPPDVVVNVAAPEPTVVNVAPPEVHVAAPNVTVEAAQIQVAAPNVTVEAPVVPAPQVVINQPPEPKLVDLQFNRDGSGKIVSATAIKE